MSEELEMKYASKRARNYPHLIFTDRLRLETDFFRWCDKNHVNTNPASVIAWLSIRGFLDEAKMIDYIEISKYDSDVIAEYGKSMWDEESHKNRIICPHCKTEYKLEVWTISDVWNFCPRCGRRNYKDVDLTEFDKLFAYLNEHGYDCEAIHEDLGVFVRHQIVVFDKDGNQAWDAICHYGTYGHHMGLLEVMGEPVVKDDDGDSVVGWLTAEDVIKRLEG